MLMFARELFTVFCVLAFGFVVWFAYNRNNKTKHEAVGQSIIEDDDSMSDDSIEQK